MDGRSQQNGTLANRQHHLGNRSSSNSQVSETNLIKKCIEAHFDNESYAKLQQVIEFLEDRLYVPLYHQYNTNLMAALHALQSYENFYPPDYSLDNYVALKVKFYSFRFISNVAKFVVAKIKTGQEKAEENFIALTKILLYHGLISRSDTANFALVELEQSCLELKITLHSLYLKHRIKFLRVIINAVLHKLSKNNGNNENGNNGNGSSSNGSGSSWSGKSNCVITYMTRALEVFNVATITSDDVAQSLVIITNIIHKDKYKGETIKLFLEYLARYQNIDLHTLIRSHIQAIMVSLLLKRKMSHLDLTASLNKLCSFCDKLPSELLATKYASIKGRLILNYSIDEDAATDAICYMSRFEKPERCKQPEAELDDSKRLIAYLNPSMIGILLGIDAHFTLHQKDLGSEESIKHIESLYKLLSMLDHSQVQAIHVKLLSTLCLLLHLRPKRTNQKLNRALRDLWAVFVSKLNKDLKISLAINICVALYDLVEDSPEDVAEIYSDLLCKDDSPELKRRLKFLFFIPDIEPMSSIYTYLTPYVERRVNVSNLQELQRSLDCVLPLMRYENLKCRLIALTRLKQLLKSNLQLLMSNMLVNLDEPLINLVSKIIESLLALSSVQEPECSSLIAECLGILGAVNPIRLDHLIYGEIPNRRTVKITNLTHPAFMVGLIERLASSLFSDQTLESENANYALQVVTRNQNILKTKKIRDFLSPEAVRACELCQHTSYQATKKSTPDTSRAVYEKFKAENQYSYKEWLDKFSVNLISIIEEVKIQEILYACSYLFKYNLKLAEYVIPHTVVYIIANQPRYIHIIKTEVMAILDEDVGVSTQDLDSVYTEGMRGNTQTLHFQCANMVFCALDAVNRLNCDPGSPAWSGSNPMEQKMNVREFMNSMPKDKLAILASKCRSQARALCYFEQYLFENRSKLDKYATALQSIYVALDDAYEAAGIEMIRSSSTTFTDDIANYEACGRFDKAFICCTAMLDALEPDADRDALIENSLRCLSSQGDYHRLYDKSKQMLNEYSQYKRNVLPYAIEATWKLGKWDELDSTFKNEQQVESLLEAASVSQGYLLTSLNDCRKNMDEKLKIVRNRLMKPLSIAMLDRSAYFRGYQNLLVLHSIEDYALSLNIFDSNSQSNAENADLESLKEKLNSLFDIWNRRNKLVQPSLRSLEPILVWQRTISLLLSKKCPLLKDDININMGRMWLTSADYAREARSFDRSFFCLTQARRWFGSEFNQLSLDLQTGYHLEQAKLDWDQGEQTRAIRSLKLSLERMRNHKVYKHLEVRRLNNKNQINTDPFPQLRTHSCNDCASISRTERESFAKLKLLLIRYCEEGAAGLPDTLFSMYEECVHLGVNQEETYFRLARYYDRLLIYYMENPKLCCEQQNEGGNQFESTQFSQSLVSGDKEEVYNKLMTHSIEAFGDSLRYGVRYLTESMPRLLNIWYDLGSKKSKTGSRSQSSMIEHTIRFMNQLKKSLPPYYFMTAMSILLSRVSHPHSGMCQATCDILELLLTTYPHQIIWQLIALVNDKQNDGRQKAAKRIMDSAKRKKDRAFEKIINDTIEVSQIFMHLCTVGGPRDKAARKSGKRLPENVTLSELSPRASRFDFSQAKVMVPNQASIRAILPTDISNLGQHVVFPPHNISYIRGFGENLRVFNSLQQPKKLTLLCENGQEIDIICKSGDDLRKDSRCIEFLNLLNRVLRKDSQSNARFFEIQTYLVLPLDSENGIIEMVQNLSTLRSVIEPLYKERKSNFSMSENLPKTKKELTPPELLLLYKTKALPRAKPPVLPTWFLRKFTEPTSWYMARLAYTRTTAVISMGGYIIGLGDRHLDNILINTCNGKTVHVDFNLLFHQGESLPMPETVPFRLTQNMEAALGPMGTEGNFRKVCEITMRVMRKEKDALLTTLKPFMHDPCSEWVKVRERGNRAGAEEDRHAENQSAKYRIEVTERKLKGYPRSWKHKPLTLIDSYSVEAQVDNLIEEARDSFNLAVMYYGWCPQF